MGYDSAWQDLRWRVGLWVFAVLVGVGSACAAWTLHGLRASGERAANQDVQAIAQSIAQTLAQQLGRAHLVLHHDARLVTHALIAVAQGLERTARHAGRHGLQPAQVAALPHLLHALQHVDEDPSHRPKSSSHGRLAQALALQPLLDVREDQLVQSNPPRNVPGSEARQAVGQHLGRLLPEGVGQHVLQRHLGVPGLVGIAPQH